MQQRYQYPNQPNEELSIGQKFLRGLGRISKYLGPIGFFVSVGLVSAGALPLIYGVTALDWVLSITILSYLPNELLYPKMIKNYPWTVSFSALYSLATILQGVGLFAAIACSPFILEWAILGVCVVSALAIKDLISPANDEPAPAGQAVPTPVMVVPALEDQLALEAPGQFPSPSPLYQQRLQYQYDDGQPLSQRPVDVPSLDPASVYQ